MPQEYTSSGHIFFSPANVFHPSILEDLVLYIQTLVRRVHLPHIHLVIFISVHVEGLDGKVSLSDV